MRRPQASLQCRVQRGDIVVSLGKCSGADARLCRAEARGGPAGSQTGLSC